MTAPFLRVLPSMAVLTLLRGSRERLDFRQASVNSAAAGRSAGLVVCLSFAIDMNQASARQSG
jgi:hypothetical protein